jgi:hypothetical protein
MNIDTTYNVSYFTTKFRSYNNTLYSMIEGVIIRIMFEYSPDPWIIVGSKPGTTVGIESNKGKSTIMGFPVTVGSKVISGSDTMRVTVKSSLYPALRV